jgi:hypothetical protein
MSTFLHKVTHNVTPFTSEGQLTIIIIIIHHHQHHYDIQGSVYHVTIYENDQKKCNSVG